MTELKNQLEEQFRHLDSLLLRNYMRMHANDGFSMTLHRGQGRVLSLLKLQPEIGQKELGYLLDMSKQALAGLLGKLEKNGYITRTESEKDRRSYIIKLTEKGRNVLEDREVEDDDLFECLNEEEQRNLSNYIDRIISVLEEKVGVDDKDDYAEFFRERFFAEHGLDNRGMPPFGRGPPRRGFGGRGGPDGFSEPDRRRRRNDRHE